MGKKLRQIEKYFFIIIVIMFFLIIFKYIVKNNIDIFYDSKEKIANEVISRDLNLNLEYNKMIKNPEKWFFAFSWVLYNSWWEWLLSWSWTENYKVINQEGYIAITNINEDNNWFIDFDWIEKYYPVNNVLKLDMKYEADWNNFKIYEQEDYLPIYWYHSVIEDYEEIKYPVLEIKKTNFDNQINYLTNMLWCRWYTLWFLTEEYILKNKKVPKHACVINFDDWRKNNYTIAYPIFKKYWVVWTFYIIIDLLWKWEYMTTQEASILYRNWNEMWSHTLFWWSLVNPTWFLRKVWRTVTKQDIYEQIKWSKDKLESRGYIVKTFAYPLWQSNEEIVNMVKESWYIWARDISKFDVWKENRTQTISFEDDRVWHLNYIKPELRDLKDFKIRTWYNTWWQFEDWYKVVNTAYDGSIRELSLTKPTENSYWVMSLWTRGDEISNKFIISKSGRYIINILWSTWEKTHTDMFEPIIVKVDWKIEQKVFDNSAPCVYSGIRYFCYYQVTIDLEEWVHTLNISNTGRWSIYVDKFNIYRNIEYKDSYNLNFLNK